MQLLFVANRIPYPPYRGDKLKIYNLARQLSKHHRLHLITFYDNEDELKYESELLKFFEKVTLVKQSKWQSYWACLVGFFSQTPFQVLYFKNSVFKKKLKKILYKHTYDGIHVQHIRMAQYFKEPLPKNTILDLPDAFSLYWKRRVDRAKNSFVKIFNKIEYHRLLNYEKRMFDYKLNLVCSKEDLGYLQSVHGIKNIALLPNGVDTETFAFSTAPHQKNRILFTGNMDYAPNIDGAVYFAEEIFPLIQKEFKGVKFVIAGQRPVRKVLELANDNIEVTGFIPKLNEMYASARVVVSPLRIGAGTQNKVLESMSMGVPVVCTQIGFEGLNVSNGQGVFMETTPQGFADAVLKILRDDDLRTKMGVEASDIVQRNFSWEKIATQLEGYFSTP